MKRLMSNPTARKPRVPRPTPAADLVYAAGAAPRQGGGRLRIMVQLYTPLVHHWCVRGGVRGADAEDVAQEVLRAAAGHMDDFRRDRPGDSFRAWLRGITRNMVLQHFRTGRPPAPSRRRDRRSTPSAAVADDASGDSSEEEDPVEELDALRRRALELVRSEFEPPHLARVLDDRRRGPLPRRHRRRQGHHSRGRPHGQIARSPATERRVRRTDSIMPPMFSSRSGEPMSSLRQLLAPLPGGWVLPKPEGFRLERAAGIRPHTRSKRQ